MFIDKSKSAANNDAPYGVHKALDHYLELSKDFKSSFGDFVVKDVKTKDGRILHFIDESEICEVGYKARAGELLIQTLVEKGYKEIVYVQPRQGFAGISLSYLCKKYGLSLTLVMPSSREASEHQLLCIELGAKPLFLRVAAMPNANAMARKYAKAVGGYFVPLGLNHELVVAAGVKIFHEYFCDKRHPKWMWSVISTGVLTRTMQIALPDTKFKAVAVSRNIQEGELGRAKFFSYHKPFSAKSNMKDHWVAHTVKDTPVINSENCYDAKGIEYFLSQADSESYFFNVAGNAPKPNLRPEDVDSFRDWNDLSDFKGII